MTDKDVPALIDALKNPDAETRWTAAQTLAGLANPAATEALIEALKDEVPLVSMSAADALANIGDPRAVDPLIETLQNGNSVSSGPQLRAAAALGRLGDRKAVAPLCAVLQERYGVDEELREVVARALGHLGDPAAIPALVTGLGSHPPPTKITTRYAILRIGPDAVGPLVAELDNEHSEFDHENFKVKCGIARVLGELGDANVTEPLLALLESDNQDVCESAIDALEKIKDPRAVDPLIKFLREGSTWIRASAASALAEIGTPAVNALIALLEDQNSETRYFTLVALGKIGDSSATDAVRGLASDPDRSVQEQASETLDQIAQGGVPSVRPPRLEGGEFRLSTCLARLNEGMYALEARELVGSPQFRMDQAAGLAAMGFGSPPSGIENWVYHTEFGTFQIVVKENEEEGPTVADLLGVEAVMEQAKAAGQ